MTNQPTRYRLEVRRKPIEFNGIFLRVYDASTCDGPKHTWRQIYSSSWDRDDHGVAHVVWLKRHFERLGLRHTRQLYAGPTMRRFQKQLSAYVGSIL